MALALIGTALAGAVNMYTCFGALSLAAALGTTSAIIAVHDKRFEDIVDAIYFFPSHANNLSRTDMHVLRGMLAEPTSEPGRVVFRNGDFVATGTIAAEVDEGLKNGIYYGNVTVSLPDHSAPVEGKWVIVEHSGNTTEIKTTFHDFRASLIALANLQDQVDTRSMAFADYLGGVKKAGE